MSVQYRRDLLETATHLAAQGVTLKHRGGGSIQLEAPLDQAVALAQTLIDKVDSAYVQRATSQKDGGWKTLAIPPELWALTCTYAARFHVAPEDVVFAIVRDHLHRSRESQDDSV